MLQTILELGQGIKDCEPSSYLKDGFIGYKVTTICCKESKPFFSIKNMEMESLEQSCKIISGWNRNKSKIEKLPIFTPERKIIKNEYLSGLHIYSSLKSAQLKLGRKYTQMSKRYIKINGEYIKNPGYHCATIIPVHFFKKDIVSEGTEIQYSFHPEKKENSSVIVVKKYFLNKEDYKNAINIFIERIKLTIKIGIL